MYRSIYVPLDNSPHSLTGLDLAIAVARSTGARVTGSHVYAAKLHERRFRQMESGLPAPYLREDRLVEQRDIHDDLITRGLRIIADSYLDVFSRRCAEAGVPATRVALEGKNWRRLVEDIGAGDCDLVVMGALGLGAVAASQIGSVCERVARRIDRDLLVVRTLSATGGGIMVALDGSPRSFGGLRTALGLARIFARPVEVISAFDPFFHSVAFDRVARVLSPEAATVFRFEEQQRLHAEIIDSGLAKIYQSHLDLAAQIARDEGVEIATTLLSGKGSEQVLRWAQERRPWLLVLGRTGVHSEEGMDLGSATETLLRQAPCNLLLSARAFAPPVEHVADATMTWTEEAEARMRRVPAFVQGLARKAVLDRAVREGHTVITSDVIDACLAAIAPKRGPEAAVGAPPPGGRCPRARAHGAGAGERTVDGPAPVWEEAATARLDRIAEDAVRAHARLRIETMARRSGQGTVTEAMVEGAFRAAAEMLAEGRPS
ncbi:MAG TPA: universal stress protein [Methylomirabilota bacterium]|nr:universal stress protein [Methylomirabilota bacterium]